MEGALLLAMTWTQLVVELLFLAWVWLARTVRRRSAASHTKRDQLLLLAAVSYTLGVAIHLYFNFGHGIEMPHRMILRFDSFTFSCIAFFLALSGRGRGRIVTSVASLELAASCLIV